MINPMINVSAMTNSAGVFTETFRYLQKAKKPQADILDLKSRWSQSVLDRLKVKLEVVGRPTDEKSILLLGNHISYLDIPVLINTAKNISFVAKHELTSWPVFGAAARVIDTVFVKRENNDSRKSARRAIHEALQNGKRIVIFPSGTTCMSESKPWKRGAFEIAHDENIFVQPFRISYRPLRTVAYIDDDFFPTHLQKLFSCGPIEAKIEFHDPVKIKNPSWDCQYWNYWARGFDVTSD